jgi:hypothetical protein
MWNPWESVEAHPWTLHGLDVDLCRLLWSQFNLKVINFKEKRIAMNEIQTWDLYNIEVDD